ncbi:uncharacterized protein LOC130046927 [Ostrea edulis]|uniref:uncharacterized protein LOC130046927 n=1 Tax=Ostrea edulis TaxID=37623 RepID=UPI0024AFF4A3|nr:uncharacterized protein LOC130046927 [Ostrea edulis]
MVLITLKSLLLLGIFVAFTKVINGHYADHIAQASCAASFSGGFVSAIRRDCESKKTCATICREGISSMRAIYGNQGSSTATCFNAFHFYYGHPNLHPKTRGRSFMAMYPYGPRACHSAFCDPNVCCYRA